MKEVVLPNVGELAVIRRNPGQDRFGCLREVPLSGLVLSKDGRPPRD